MTQPESRSIKLKERPIPASLRPKTKNKFAHPPYLPEFKEEDALRLRKILRNHVDRIDKRLHNREIDLADPGGALK